MKHLYAIFFLFFISSETFATAPTIAASNLNFPQVDGGYFNVAWTAGNGARRLIVCKAGGPVSFRPQNGIDYTEHTNFGSGQQVASGEYIVYDNAFTSFFLTGLSPATQYFFAVFEYNGTGVATEYLTSSFLSGSNTTSAVPALQTSNAVFSSITTNSVTVSWTNGSGQRRLLVVREGSPVNADPVNSQPYNSNSVFGSGATVGTGNYAVYNSSSTATVVTNLKPGTQYFFAFYEFNGSSQPQYKTPAYTANVTTRSIPTIASSNVVITKTDGKELSLSWTNGNGQRRIVVAKEGSSVTAVPASGTDYNANAVFGTGAAIAPGEFVVYDDNFNAAVISGLNPATTYFFRIYEYDGTGTQTTYLISSFGAVNGSTAVTPLIQASALHTISVSGSSLNLAFTPGSGRARLVIGRKNAPVAITPQNFTVYNEGADLGTDHFVAGITTGPAVVIGGLQANTPYHFAVFEFNGFNQPLYLSPGALFSTATGAPLPVKLLSWDALVKEQWVQLKWSTATEVNASRFIIERSKNGLDYEELLSVPAKGNSHTVQHYVLEDKQPLKGKSFYRLKMVDQDGTAEYSGIRAVTREEVSKTRLLATLVNDRLDFISQGASNQWVIINQTGQLLAKGTAAHGRNQVIIGNLLPGKYWIRFSDGTTLSFIRQ